MAAHRTGRYFKCEQCGARFYRSAADLRKQPKPRFCTMKPCYADYRRERAAFVSTYPKIGRRHAHRVIAEQKLGRTLKHGEIVHHEDENRRNFEPSNLEVLAGQSEHVKGHWRRGTFTKHLKGRTAST